MEIYDREQLRRIGERIKQIRVNAGMTQDEFASSVGLSRPTLALYEQGKREMGILIALQISEEWGISLDELLLPLYEQNKKRMDSKEAIRFCRQLGFCIKEENRWDDKTVEEQNEFEDQYFEKYGRAPCLEYIKISPIEINKHTASNALIWKFFAAAHKKDKRALDGTRFEIKLPRREFTEIVRVAKEKDPFYVWTDINSAILLQAFMPDSLRSRIDCSSDELEISPLPDEVKK